MKLKKPIITFELLDKRIGTQHRDKRKTQKRKNEGEIRKRDKQERERKGNQ
jgi:hypothetical protein